MPEPGPVFVHDLRLTFNPADFPQRDLERLLQEIGAHALPVDPEKRGKPSLWRVGYGTALFVTTARYCSASLSGSAVEELVGHCLLSDFVSICASSPCRVTRLDVTADVLTDAPPILLALHGRYPRFCHIAGKPSPTHRRLDTRPDGKSTGSWYVGKNTDAAISAIVYDKAWERLVVAGATIPPTTRYEIRIASKAQPSLADVLDPAPAFWHYAGGRLLPWPKVRSPAWVRGRDLSPWVSSWLPRPVAATMLDRIGSSPELAALASLAVDVGPHGPDLLCRQVEARLRKLVVEERERRACPAETERPAPRGGDRSGSDSHAPTCSGPAGTVNGGVPADTLAL